MTNRRRPIVAGFAALALGAGVAGCGVLPMGEANWKVDVVNPGPDVIVSISTERAAWMWLVPRGSRFVLLREPAALEGQVRLINRQCEEQEWAALERQSFSIHPLADAEEVGHFEIELTWGATVEGPTNTNYFGGCSG